MSSMKKQASLPDYSVFNTAEILRLVTWGTRMIKLWHFAFSIIIIGMSDFLDI